MAMTANRVVQLCEQSVSAIKEDMAQLEAGALKYKSAVDLDVTGQQVSRMRAVVSYLQEIIDGCGCECG